MKITTSWMWQSRNGGVNGLVIDTDRNRLQWYDEVGCACGDSTTDQTYDDYLTNGDPGFNPPDDVRAEIREALATLAG